MAGDLPVGLRRYGPGISRGGYDLYPAVPGPRYPRFARWSWVACGASGLPGVEKRLGLHKPKAPCLSSPRRGRKSF